MGSLPIAEPREDSAVLTAVERALAELRRGEPILLHDKEEGPALVRAAESARPPIAGPKLLIVSARRAEALGLESKGAPVALQAGDLSLQQVAELADPTSPEPNGLEGLARSEAPRGLASGSIELAKLARLLPATLLQPLELAQAPDRWAQAQGLHWLTTDDLVRYGHFVAASLEPVAEAEMPLADAENTRMVAFRPRDGGAEHLAVIIGEPDPEVPLLLRLHSECLTGDLLGSLRCDCGDQLRGAIAAISEQGAGILIYLAQEGRGIGLVNKLRAYRLQDQGADTLDANLQLGFEADERVYLPAAEILRRLGYSRVRLMTNNPEKVAALSRCGIEVAERVPHTFPANGHNEFYLATKASRFGHLF